MTTIQCRFEERAPAVWSSARRQQQFGWQAPTPKLLGQVWELVYLLDGKTVCKDLPRSSPHKVNCAFGAIAVLELLLSKSETIPSSLVKSGLAVFDLSRFS